MKIAGISNFYLPTMNNRLNLSDVKRAEIEVRDIPKPLQKNVYTYVGGFGTYSNKSMKENIENFLSIVRNIEVKEAEWQCDTIELPTGEVTQLKQFKYDNSANLRKVNVVNLINIQE
ncbi:hypothetical protein [Alkaliphilus peptidifermentans]|uniref:Uncharacterized protein n=1 Tax=Alkaliphilus peptidifermentans DSM 18978 TaxID=1120976 RepID=A0A1G5K909_9FIRM|nr:hypothetical protein [Alkaliphilus peptidifermentans]SCY97133.1 hypothetical protein SAMN03080606_03328 [Alkaliphilus peptidifermentans DSM 18978]